MVRSREEILSEWYHDGFGVNNSAGVIVSSLGPGLNCSHCGAGRFFNASTFTCAALLLEAGSDLVVVAVAASSEAAVLVVLEDVTGVAAGVVAAAAACADVVIPEVATLAEGTAAVVGAALAADAGVGGVGI